MSGHIFAAETGGEAATVDLSGGNLTFVIIQEVELENWGAGGLPTPEFRKRQAEKSSG